jgi:hypothetical protein
MDHVEVAIELDDYRAPRLRVGRRLLMPDKAVVIGSSASSVPLSAAQAALPAE